MSEEVAIPTYSVPFSRFTWQDMAVVRVFDYVISVMIVFMVIVMILCRKLLGIEQTIIVIVV